MATKFSSSMLLSNFEALASKGTELTQIFQGLQAEANKAGSAVSDMAQGSLGNIQNLTSEVTRLSAALQRINTTSSAIGAAAVSGALGQLTGQGRGGGGGGGGGRSGSSGGFSGNLGGGAADAAAEGASLLERIPLIGPLIRLTKKLALNPVTKFAAGTVMAGLQKTRNARLGFEQSRYYSPISGIGQLGTKGGLGGIGQFRGFAAMGMDANRASEITEGLLGAMGGRGGRVLDAERYTQFGTKFGMTPEEMNPLAGAITLGGGDIGDVFGQQRLIGRQANRTTANRLAGVNFGTNTGRRIQAFRAERFRNARLLTQQTADFYAQQAQFGLVDDNTRSQIPGFLGAIGRGTGQPGMAGSILNTLRRSTLAPGGGEAGQVLNLQAAGFGNPYLAEEQAMAARLGIDAPLERRDYLQSQLFKEQDPTGMILNKMVSIATRMQGSSMVEQGYGLHTSTDGALSLTQSTKLMQMLQSGKLSADQIRGEIDTKRMGAAPGDADLTRKTGYAGSEFMKQQAELANVYIASTAAARKASAALNDVQKALARLSMAASEQVVDVINRLTVLLTDQGMKQMPPKKSKKKGKP